MDDTLQVANDFERVFSFNNLYNAAKLCTLGVGWKGSTQYFKAHMMSSVVRLHRQLLNGTWKSKGFISFTINERGKMRHIQSVHITERTVQRCLCDNSLIPLISRKLIFDNSACLKGKGIDFAINRARLHMQKYYHRYGTEGYVLRVDIKDYFANISHKILKEKLRPLYTDERLYGLLCTLIDNCGGERGLGLGSQISQSCALFYLSDIDHKYSGCGYYARYMDDIYIINKDREILKTVLCGIKKDLEAYGIEISENKTVITTLRHGMKFLKKRFELTETGKVLVLPLRQSYIREHRKLKQLRPKVESGEVTHEAVRTNYTSWSASIRKLNSYKSLRRFDLKENIHGLIDPEDKK